MAASAGVSHVLTVLHGNDSIFASSGSERAVRCLVVAFFLALPLFVAVELSPTVWALATALFLILFHVHLPHRDAWNRLRRPLVCWLALAALAAASAIWSLAPARSFNAAVVLAGYTGAAAVIISYMLELSAPQQNRVWSALVAGAVIALIELTSIELYSVVTRWDAARTFHKITLYGILAAAVLLNDSTVRAALRGAFVVIFFAIPTLLIGKTSGINLMILAAVAFYFMPSRTRPKLLLIIFAIYCLLALAAPWLAHPIFKWTDQSFISRFNGVGSFMARLELWKLMAPYILERPWLGHGADTVRISEFIIQHIKYYDLPDIPSAHNMIFDQWYELGLLGVVALLALLGMTLRDIVTSDSRYSLTTIIVFLGFLVELSVDHRIWLSWVQGVAVFAAAVVVLMTLRINHAGHETSGNTH